MKVIIRDAKLKNFVKGMMENYAGSNLLQDIHLCMVEILQDEFIELKKKGKGSIDAINILAVRYGLTFAFTKKCVYERKNK